MAYLLTFLVSVAANLASDIMSRFICKWLDRYDDDRKPTFDIPDFSIPDSPQKSSAVQKVYKRPLRRFAPALPEGEPLAGRVTFH